VTETSRNTAGQPWYVTTAIPYVNARPHIGFALEAVQTDAFARHHRLRGEDVRFLTGTDENSLKNVQAAEAEGVPTQELVDRYAEAFMGLRETLNLSFDDFIITNFNAGSEVTFPMFVWGAAQRGVPPQVNVIGALMFLLALLVVFGSEVARRRRARG